jgi:hypothetical protein
MQMVNAGFPKPVGYGFEIVDAIQPGSQASSTENLRRIKICRVFREFSAI